MAIQSITTLSNWTITSVNTGNSALAAGATITFPYPSGYTQGNFQPGGEVLSVPSMAIIVSALPCQYTSAGIVATNNSGFSIPANTALRLQTGGIVTSSLPAAPVQPTVPVVTPTTGLDPTRLINWITARNKARAGVGRGRIICIGDSTTAGVGATDAIGRIGQSYPALMASAMASFGVPTSTKSWMGHANTSTANYPTYNSQVTLGAGWAQDGQESIGGGGWLNSTNANALAFTPVGNIDSFETYTLQSSSAGVLNWAVDAGGTTGITETNATEGFIRSATLSAGAAGTHTLNFTRSSGSAYLKGVVAWDSTTPAVDVINCGRGSATTSTLLPGTVRGWSPINAIPVLAADLALINLGINDYTPATLVALATYQANLQTLITTCKASGTTDVILVWPTPSASSRQTLAIQAQYQAAMYAVAQSNNVPVIDLTVRWQSYAQQPAANYFDTVHPTRQGYADIGSYIGFLLASV